jgi:AraC-like DNA-binding protein
MKTMAQSPIEELQRQIAKLSERVEQLLGRPAEARTMFDVIGPEIKSRIINSMSAAEVGPHLRAVALRCARLSKESFDARAARELEDLSIVLADRASSLETINVEERVPHGGLAGWQQKRLVEYIASRLDKKISLTDLAKVAKLSPYHFARAFRRSFGESPHRYLVSRRIERAKTLLENPAVSVTEIAIAIGFADLTSFASAFRRSVGTTPSQYRRSAAASNNHRDGRVAIAVTREISPNKLRNLWKRF